MTGRPVRSGGYREPSNPSESGGGRETTTLWSAADRGDTEKVRELLTGSGSGEDGAVAGGGGKPVDVNARNCLGCTPLLYASGSGHVETVRIALYLFYLTMVLTIAHHQYTECVYMNNINSVAQKELQLMRALHTVCPFPRQVHCDCRIL